MKGCKHFRLDGTYYLNIEPMLPNGVDAKIHVLDENGDDLFDAVAPFMWLTYLQHLSESPRCRKEVGTTLEELQQHLKQAEENFEKEMKGYDD